MRNVLIEYIIGVAIFLAGLLPVYLYFTGDEKHLWLFGISLVLAIISLGFLIHSALRHSKIAKNFKEPSSTDPSIVVKTKGVNIFKKNSEIVAQLRKTEESRDRLKLLKLSADENGE